VGRESNFNMSGYAIHYMDTYMDFYLLFIHLEDIDSHYCPYVYVPLPPSTQRTPSLRERRGDP
jgi:hypothetical protein